MLVALCAAALGQAPHHAPVAPWDVPDAPNPDPAVSVAASPPDPPAMIQASGAHATLPNGVAVELMAVARRRWSRKVGSPPPLPDSQPAWSPDGSPYLGAGPGERPIQNVLQTHPTGGLMPTPGEGKAFDDRGARYLALRFTGPPNGSIDLYGYVPGSARPGEPKPERHGRDVPLALALPDDGRLDYETEIVVDDRAARGYRLAAATGEWKTVANVAVDPARATGATTLARGGWGELRQDARALDRVREAQAESLRKNGFAIGPSISPHADYAVAFPEPPVFATRLRLIDRFGQTTTLPKVQGRYGGPSVEGRFEWPAVRVEVQARPYAWFEFSGVRYDPDPARWPAAYWGKEGEKTESRSGGTALQAIVLPTIAEGKRATSHVYAPDGRLWRNHPRPDEVSLFWPDLAAYGEDRSPVAKAFASIHLDPAFGGEEGRAWVEGFASESDTPGAVRAPLDPPRQFTARLKAEQYPFVRPATPYVQFGVRYALPWRTVAEFAPPTPREIASYAKDRAALAAKFGPFGVVRPRIRSEGRADMELVVAGEARTREGVARWTPADPLELTRLVARLRTGARHPIGEMAFGAQGFGGAFFALDEQGRPFHQTDENSIWPKVRFLLSDVAAFEVEAQDYTKPAFVVARLPTPSP